MGRRRFFFSAGDPSGDLHAAGLIRAMRQLDATVEAVGLGGPAMQGAGCDLLANLTAMAVTGFAKPIRQYWQFRKHLTAVRRYFAENKSEIAAVVIVDFPGFNWHVAAAAKAVGLEVIYFMPPQLWAWASWRVSKMRHFVDHVLSPLAFEHRWFESHGISSTFIGHPFLESMRNVTLDAAFLERLFAASARAPIVTLLPGSRDQEVAANTPMMLAAIKKLHESTREVFPVIAAFHERHAAIIAKMLEHHSLTIPIYVGKTAELIRAADCAVAVSGSVSMELLASNTPAIIVYRVGRFNFWLQRWLRHARWITLVNLLEEDLNYGDSGLFVTRQLQPCEPSPETLATLPMPEFLCTKDRSGWIAVYLLEYLRFPSVLAEKKSQLRRILEAADAVPSPLALAAELILAKS